MVGRATIVNHRKIQNTGLKHALEYLSLRHKDLNELTKDLFKNMDRDELGVTFQLDYCIIGSNHSLVGKQWYIKHTNGINKPDEYFDSFYEAIAYILRVFW